MLMPALKPTTLTKIGSSSTKDVPRSFAVVWMAAPYSARVRVTWVSANVTAVTSVDSLMVADWTLMSDWTVKVTALPTMDWRVGLTSATPSWYSSGRNAKYARRSNAVWS